MTMPTPLAEHEEIADALVAEAHAHDGLAPLDVEQFWADNEAALSDPFSPALPHPGLLISSPAEAVFIELNQPADFWRYDQDEAYRLQLNRAYNDRAEQIIGRRLLPETLPPLEDRYPRVGGLADVFGAKSVWASGSWWLEQAVEDVSQLPTLLDRVDRTSVRQTILPDGWEQTKERLQNRGIQPPRYRHQRGPVTFATSIVGTEALLMLLLDDPALAIRLRDTILRVMMEIKDILAQEAGYAPGEEPGGFNFADDNCALLNPDLYAMFGQPVLKAMYERYCPTPGDVRYQHSDSAMAHLLPLLAETGMNRVNFGPTVSVAEIRRHMPHAVIAGRIAPFTLGRNDEPSIVREVLRDIDEARETRGLLIATAGSIVEGSRLTGMRLMMATIQRYGRY